MADGPRIGLAFSGQPYALREVVEAAVLAESYGAESVWVADDFWTGRDAFSILPIVAYHTRSLRIGTAVTNPYTRSPALLALAFSTLADVAAGRLVLGLGAGEAWKTLYPASASGASPLRDLRQAVGALRSLLAGRPVEVGGAPFALANTWPYVSGAIAPYRGSLPIYLGAAGPRMTSLAGEIADGLLLGLRARPDEVTTRLNWLARGAAKAGRDPRAIETAKLVLVSVTTGGPANPNVLRHVARVVAQMPAETVEALGYEPERVARLRQAFNQAAYDAAAALLQAEMIDAHAIVGTPEACLQRLASLAAGGVGLPILLPLGGELAPVLALIRTYTSGGLV